MGGRRQLSYIIYQSYEDDQQWQNTKKTEGKNLLKHYLHFKYVLAGLISAIPQVAWLFHSTARRLCTERPFSPDKEHTTPGLRDASTGGRRKPPRGSADTRPSLPVAGDVARDGALAQPENASSNLPPLLSASGPCPRSGPGTASSPEQHEHRHASATRQVPKDGLILLRKLGRCGALPAHP